MVPSSLIPIFETGSWEGKTMESKGKGDPEEVQLEKKGTRERFKPKVMLLSLSHKFRVLISPFHYLAEQGKTSEPTNL
jgi:hypothetical protein